VEDIYTLHLIVSLEQNDHMIIYKIDCLTGLFYTYAQIESCVEEGFKKLKMTNYGKTQTISITSQMYTLELR
jgi:hypothetical protein